MNAPLSGRLAGDVEAATGVALRFAVAVDREGRLPAEALASLRQERLLGAMVPVALGGEGASLREIAGVCASLGGACGSTGLIYAMHQIQVASVIAGGIGSEWHRDFLARLAREQMLLASVTSEELVGGDVRTSRCAVERTGDIYDSAQGVSGHLVRGARRRPADHSPSRSAGRRLRAGACGG